MTQWIYLPLRNLFISNGEVPVTTSHHRGFYGATDVVIKVQIFFFRRKRPPSGKPSLETDVVLIQHCCALSPQLSMEKVQAIAEQVEIKAKVVQTEVKALVLRHKKALEERECELLWKVSGGLGKDSASAVGLC